MSSIEFLGLALVLSTAAGLARGLRWTPPRFTGARTVGEAGALQPQDRTEEIRPPDFWLRERRRRGGPRPATQVAPVACCAAAPPRGR